MMIDNIHNAIEKAVEGFDFSNNDNYEFEFGMEYDGKVYLESIIIQEDDLIQYIMGEINNKFKLSTTKSTPVSKHLRASL